MEMQDDVSELLRSATREYKQTRVRYEELKLYLSEGNQTELQTGELDLSIITIS